MINDQAYDIAKQSGYETWHTGGGCMAFHKSLDLVDGRDQYCLISNNDDIDCDADPNAKEWIIGIYDNDSFINVGETFTLKNAIAALDAITFPAPTSNSWDKFYPDLNHLILEFYK
jgi:hypothetical protein|tara:strand:- start:748 stop:1095 length:348 start_codon:yes stop_codon:yes gene_type:complete